MFEEPSEIEVKKGQGTEYKPKPAPFSWKSHSVADLVAWRDQITAVLPPLSLAEMNMEEEVLLQYHSLRALQNDVLGDEAIPLNQRAQIANSVTGALTKLVDMQSSVYTQERFKAIEGLMIRHLNRLPAEAAEAFIAEYEKYLLALK